MAAMGAGAAVQTYVHSPEFLPDVHHAVADLVNRVFTDALPQMPTISADGGIVHLAMQLRNA
jgi:hypothetical protein